MAVKPLPASSDSSACQARRRGPLSGAARRAGSFWDSPIVVIRARAPKMEVARTTVCIGSEARGGKAFVI